MMRTFGTLELDFGLFADRGAPARAENTAISLALGQPDARYVAQSTINNAIYAESHGLSGKLSMCRLAF
jgi:hypothetical protein